ncbi:PhzF family phenazine biosynthesis protein [Kineococcus sp. R86509]|uniref:PhzF family phenazine biosynthesis protein n=1 Tax=Kineococcus sp. R86509 TaxID=3093851 RepID=UPI0036D23417
MPALPFTQVDVFSEEPLGGNPVAVVHDADDLTSGQMQRFANWTNLSETTFLLRPSTSRADYRVRIFTTEQELPFAGHPTLGSVRAWLTAGGNPQIPGVIVQECGAGLVEVRVGEPHLAFAAPPLFRKGPLEAELLERLVAGLGISPADVVSGSHLHNGPQWVVLQVSDAATVLGLVPVPGPLAGLDVGVVGRHPAGHETQIEVRAFVSDGRTVVEDPVTGSLNAGVGQWLTDLPPRYVAAQGTAVGRSGRVHVERDGSRVWVGGATAVVVSGVVRP